MNKYLKRYITKRENINPNERANFSAFELQYVDLNKFSYEKEFFGNSKYYSLITNISTLLKSDNENLVFLLKNKTYYQFRTSFYLDLAKHINNKETYIHNIIKNINKYNDIDIYTLFYLLEPELVNSSFKILLDTNDEFDIKKIVNLPTKVFKSAENVIYVCNHPIFIQYAAKNLNTVTYSAFFNDITDKQRLLFVHNLIKKTNFYTNYNAEELYIRIYGILNYFEDKNMRAACFKLFIRNKEIKDILNSGIYYTLLSKKYEIS